MGVPLCYRKSCLVCVLDFSICEVLFVFLNSLHKRDATLLSVGFTVMLIQPPFSPSEVDPFVGFMDSDNVPHVIICNVVSVFDLQIGQDFC